MLFGSWFWSTDGRLRIQALPTNHEKTRTCCCTCSCYKILCCNMQSHKNFLRKQACCGHGLRSTARRWRVGAPAARASHQLDVPVSIGAATAVGAFAFQVLGIASPTPRSHPRVPSRTRRARRAPRRREARRGRAPRRPRRALSPPPRGWHGGGAWRGGGSAPPVCPNPLPVAARPTVEATCVPHGQTAPSPRGGGVRQRGAPHGRRWVATPPPTVCGARAWESRRGLANACHWPPPRRSADGTTRHHTPRGLTP